MAKLKMQILGIFFEVAMTFSARASMSSAAKARGKREDPFARSWPPSSYFFWACSAKPLLLLSSGLIIKQHVLKFVLHVTPLFNITNDHAATCIYAWSWTLLNWVHYEYEIIEKVRESKSRLRFVQKLRKGPWTPRKLGWYVPKESCRDLNRP